MATKKTTPVVSETQVDQASAPSPQLSINDIQSAIAAIDYACQQGAFKGWEVITSVFETREKLARFVASVAVPVAPGEGA
jgi:hypothetical protein